MTICCCASFTLILSACAQVVYYDGQFDDARLNVALACTAASIGAAVVNHTKCTKLLKVSKGLSTCCCRNWHFQCYNESTLHAGMTPATPCYAQDGTGSVIGVEAFDEVTGKTHQVHAKVVINAGGPFSDSVRWLADPAAPATIMPSSGEAAPESPGTFTPCHCPRVALSALTQLTALSTFCSLVDYPTLSFASAQVST